MVEDINGVITRLCYGTAKIVDTYAYDEVNEEEG